MRLILFGVIGIFSLIGGFYLVYFYQSEAYELETVSELFDGPDKSLRHNYYMIEDRKEGRVPFERLLEVRNLIQARLRNDDRNFNWKNWSTSIPGRSRAILFHEPSGVLFAGSVTGGLWKNPDFKGDVAWEVVGDFDGVSVSSIVNDPNDSKVLYLGTGESFTAFLNYRESTGLGNGMYKSTDSGNTWSKITSTSNFYFINDILVRNEAGTSVLYVAVGSGFYRGSTFVQEGLYRSKNQGITWEQVLPNIPGTAQGYCISDLELTKDNRILAGTMRNIHNVGGGVILISDDGETWSQYSGYVELVNLIGGVPGRVIVKSAPSNASHIYALFTRGNRNELGQLRDYTVNMKESLDGGISWTDLPLPTAGQWANIPWHALALAVDPINENKVLLGALDMYVLHDATNVSNPSFDFSKLTNWAIMYDLYNSNLSDEEKQTRSERYIHADIHDIQFIGENPNNVVIATDGGVFYSDNMGITQPTYPEYPAQNFPVFRHSNNDLITTQYHYASIHPDKNKWEVIGGTQDNGSVYVNNTPGYEKESMISGGDGGYAFWDRDNPEVKITSVYGNRYYIHVGNEVYFRGPINGLFINPATYDDESNLIYSNMATSSYGGLYPSLRNRHYDSLEIINVNTILKTPNLNLPEISFVALKAGLTSAITAIKLSTYSEKLNKTAVIGTEDGKVYRVQGLPYNVSTKRIDNNQLPNGYISSIDIGQNESTILLTISNFGLPSIWVTKDGGGMWQNLQRDLPDMPVRWGVFNPFDDQKIMLATEMGVWGLENSANESEGWISYSFGLPPIRIDMIDIRSSDSTILAATHGHGLWVGKFTQGDIITSVEEIKKYNDKVSWLYPNPAYDFVQIVSGKAAAYVKILDNKGNVITSCEVNENGLDIRSLSDGFYIFNIYDKRGIRIGSQRILVCK